MESCSALRAMVLIHSHREYTMEPHFRLYSRTLVETSSRKKILHNPNYLGSFTVKIVYKDHPRDQQNVVLIHRWSLYAGSIAWKVYTLISVECDLYKQVSLCTSSLYSRFNCTGKMFGLETYLSLLSPTIVFPCVRSPAGFSFFEKPYPSR